MQFLRRLISRRVIQDIVQRDTGRRHVSPVHLAVQKSFSSSSPSSSSNDPESSPSSTVQQGRQAQSKQKEPHHRITQISVNRSGLLPTRMHYGEGDEKPPREGLVRELEQMIELSGPITLAEYMLYALQHPTLGYYMRKESKIGRGGDFVTAPEISQVFGELIGVWCVATWTAMGSPSKFNLIELGPGKGTLVSDVMRAASSFPEFRKAFTLHLVETSDDLRMLQMEALGLTSTQGSEDATGHEPGLRPRTGVSLPGGGEVFWHTKLGQVPKGPSLFIAQEFLDALPVHQFQYTAEGWREILVDSKTPDTGGVSDTTGSGVAIVGGGDGGQRGGRARGIEVISTNDEDVFRLVLSAGETTAVQAFLKSKDELPVYLGGKKHSKGDNKGKTPTGSRGESIGDRLEVSPESMVLVKEVASRIAEYGGGALFVDYGEDHAIDDSLRSYKGHKEVSVLSDPGGADITADVNFAVLGRIVAGVKGARPHGPVGQGQFLGEMGIGERLRALAEQDHVSEEQVEAMLEGYIRLVDPAQMGMRYKVLAITDDRQETPPGFLSVDPLP